MSLNFNFLKPVNVNLYELARTIEKSYEKSPEAVLCMGTTFLDNLVYQICKQTDYPYEEKSSINRINSLENDEIISKELANHLVDGFLERNKMHHVIESVSGYFFDNKNRARKLYRHIYSAACTYYKEFHDKNFHQSFKEPETIKNIFEKEERCPICGSKTKNNSILCSECDYDIELLNHLNSMIKKFGFDTNFSKPKMEEIGFNKSETSRILIDLKNKELITKRGITYSFNKESILEYRQKIKDYMEIRDLVLEININDLSSGEIKDTHAYISGSENQEPFTNFYNSIFRKFGIDFENAIEKNSYIKVVESRRIFTEDEFKSWASNNLDNKIFFIQLKDSYLEFKKECNTDSCIIEKMHITDEILDYIKNHSTVKDEIIEIRKSKYIHALRTFRTFDDALRESKLTEVEVNHYKSQDPEFREKCNKELKRRKDRFLVELKIYGLKDAFMKSKLKEKHLQKEFDKKFKSDFYKEMIHTLQEKFISNRKSGKTERECIEECQIPDELYDKWLNIPKFADKLSKVELELLFKSIKNNESLSDGLRIANMKKREFNKYVLAAYEDKDIDLIELYESNVLPKEFSNFLNKFKRNNEKTALRKAKLDKKLLDVALKDDKKSKRYLDIKIIKYISVAITENHNKALRYSDLSKQEYSKHKDYISNKIEKLRPNIVLAELDDGKTTKQAAKKAGVSVDDIYNWYRKGRYSAGIYGKFSHLFEILYIKPVIEHILSDEIDKNKLYKYLIHKNRVTREDVKFWKKLHIVSNFPDIEFFTIETPDF